MKRRLLQTLLLPMSLVTLMGGAAVGQSISDVLAEFDSATDVISGDWTKTNGELFVSANAGSRAVLAKSAPEDYALTVEFTRSAGSNAIGIILPVGSSQCAFIMSAFNGEAHGIGVIDGKLAKQNISTITPGKLDTSHPYRLLIEVDVSGDSASISSTLDGRPFLKWEGNPKSLTMLDFWKLPSAKSLGLCTYAETTFHSITLSRLDPNMRMTGSPPSSSQNPTSASKSIRFEGKVWSAPQAESVAVEDFKGKRALHIKGGEENFVFLPNVDFGDGVIEVDIASKTFSGVGYRSDSNGKVVEKLYFRPFNSGTEKHANTVQYSMLGKPPFGWKALRASNPGKYESGAAIEVNEWFHARIVLKGKRLAAYVNDSPEPILVVDNTLGDNPTGAVGLWGWDSYFANFRFTPAR